MPSTYSLIASATPTTGTSVSFTSIPDTYTDLVLRISARSNYTSTYLTTLYVGFNNNSSNLFSFLGLQAISGSISLFSGSSGNAAGDLYIPTENSNITSNLFGSAEIYIPNYKASIYKQFSSNFCLENTNTTNYYSLGTTSSMFASTSTISSIQVLIGDGNFVSGSSLYLYGIKNS